MGYGGRMKANQIIGALFILAGAGCFWLDTSGQSDWKIAIGGIALVLLGLWVGKFNFRKNRDGGA
jgi:drug/metabolite transporter (DMT)-like permease